MVPREESNRVSALKLTQALVLTAAVPFSWLWGPSVPPAYIRDSQEGEL